MADESRKVELAKSRFDTAMGALTFVLWAGAMYYSMDRDGFERNLEKVSSFWQRLQHRVSVWQAQEAIRSLPVTDITDITDTGATQ